MKESLFRNYASVASVKTDVAVFAEEFHSKAEWIPENQAIQLHDGEEDFQRILLNHNKLATLLKFPEDFVHNPSFDIERYILKYFAKAMSRAEDEAFITGNGVDIPIGILHPERGAEVGVTTQELTYDSVITHNDSPNHWIGLSINHSVASQLNTSRHVHFISC